MFRTLCFISALAVGVTAQAQLIAYEGFDYELRGYTGSPNPEGISGFNGGFGWANPWQQSAGSPHFSGIVSPTEQGPHDATDPRTSDLAYTDTLGNTLQTSGRQYRTSFGNWSGDTRTLDLSGVDSSYLVDDGTGQMVLGADNTSVWLSFLAQSYANLDGNRWAQVRFADFRIGRIFDNAGNTGWAIEDAQRSNQIFTGSPADQQALLVVRFDFNPGADSATLWINPTLGQTPLDSEGYTFHSPSSRFASTLEIAGRYSTDFDEIRVGLDYGSVTPVPEPATMTLLALGALAALRKKRATK